MSFWRIDNNNNDKEIDKIILNIMQQKSVVGFYPRDTPYKYCVACEDTHILWKNGLNNYE